MKTVYIFLILSIVSICTTLLLNKYVYTEEYYYYTLQDKFTQEQTKEFIKSKEKTQWLLFIKTPLFLFLKTAIVAGVISAGLNLFKVDIRLKEIFRISLEAEAVFVVPQLIKLLWFSLI